MSDDGLRAAFPAEAVEPPPTIKTRPLRWDDVKAVRWLWEGRIPVGKLSLLIAEEGGGKGTLGSWIAVAVMRGDLYSTDEPGSQRVMIVGDEDGLEDTWVPRLMAAGATKKMLDQLLVIPDQEIALPGDQEALTNTARDEKIGWMIFDQVLDHIDGGKDGSAIYNAKHIRDAMRPLRYVARDADIAVTANLHPIKGSPRDFRDLIGGSHQFNAVSRSSLWLGSDPDSDDPLAKVLVRGKGNLAIEPPAVEFRIGSKDVEIEGRVFSQPTVEDLKYGERYRRDFEAQNAGFGKSPTKPASERLEPTVLSVLTAVPQTVGGVEAAVKAAGVQCSRNSVSKALAALAAFGQARNDGTPTYGKWVKVAIVTPGIS